MTISIEFEGLEVEIWRSKVTGKLVVQIDTGGLKESDTHPSTAVPDIQVYVNDDGMGFRQDGESYDLVEEASVDSYVEWAMDPAKEQRERND